ncbi:Acyl-CoA-binding domain-containing protein 5 [Sarcoptes scabiei]|nr:Acyl-CoA-binding domain-containing protein 5 [Sarcoptes scabiei]
MSIENQFDAAVKVIQSLPKDGFFQPSDEVRLRFYAFYKQATEGPNLTKKPAFYELVNRYKWNAWKQCGDMSRFEAMRLYVEELKKDHFMNFYRKRLQTNRMKSQIIILILIIIISDWNRTISMLKSHRVCLIDSVTLFQ